MDMVADSYGSEIPAGNFYWFLYYCLFPLLIVSRISCACLLYTSDAADDLYTV